MTRFRNLAAAALLATALAGFGAPAHAEWLEARSAHFTVYGNMSADDLRARTLKLERFDALMRKLFSVGETPNVTVYEMGSAAQIQALLGAGAGSIYGFYNADAEGAKAFVPDTLPDFMSNENITNAQEILFHEYTHHILLSNVDGWMPTWAQEGLAEMFGTATLDKDGGITVGTKPDGRRFSLFGMGRWTVQRMFEANAHPAKAGDEFSQNYSMGWALSHYLWFSGKRPGQFTAYIKAINDGGDQVGAAQKVFGDLGKLDQEVNRYVSVGKFRYSRFTAAQLSAPTDVAIRPLTEGEAAMIPFRIRSTAGVTEKTAGPLADRARPVAARFPDNAVVQRALAEIEHDAKNYDAADAAANRVLAIDPKDVRAMVYKGRVAARKAVADGAKGDWRAARNWFLDANAADPNAALPFMLYYDSFVAAGVPATKNAIAGLSRAHELVPEDQGLRVRLAIEALRAGDKSRARSILAPVAYAAEGSGDNPAFKLIAAIDSGIDNAALLAKADELKLTRFNDFIDPPKDDKKTKS